MRTSHHNTSTPTGSLHHMTTHPPLSFSLPFFWGLNFPPFPLLAPDPDTPVLICGLLAPAPPPFPPEGPGPARGSRIGKLGAVGVLSLLLPLLCPLPRLVPLECGAPIMAGDDPPEPGCLLDPGSVLGPGRPLAGGEAKALPELLAASSGPNARFVAWLRLPELGTVRGVAVPVAVLPYPLAEVRELPRPFVEVVLFGVKGCGALRLLARSWRTTSEKSFSTFCPVLAEASKNSQLCLRAYVSPCSAETSRRYASSALFPMMRKTGSSACSEIIVLRKRSIFWKLV